MWDRFGHAVTTLVLLFVVTLSFQTPRAGADDAAAKPQQAVVSVCRQSSDVGMSVLNRGGNAVNGLVFRGFESQQGGQSGGKSRIAGVKTIDQGHSVMVKQKNHRAQAAGWIYSPALLERANASSKGCKRAPRVFKAA